MTKPNKDDHPLLDQPRPDGSFERVTVTRQRAVERSLADQPFLTYAIIILNVLIFAAGFLSRALELELFVAGALFPPLVVLEGQYLRLFSAMFLHGGLAHLLFNMYALYVVGGNLEPMFGRPRMLLIYLLGGLTGSALSLALGNFLQPSVGASGAVFAIFAAQAVHLHQHRHVYHNVRGRLRHMLFLIGINLVIGFMPGSRIDNWGHIGGMLGGAILAWRLAPRFQRPTRRPASVSEFARTDSNPLRLHLPEVVIFCFALIGFVLLVSHLLAANSLNLIAQ